MQNAVLFFDTAIKFFKHSSRLLSEAAVCFKLAGRVDAQEKLEEAIRLYPYKEETYRNVFERASTPTQIVFRDTDCIGDIIGKDFERMKLIIEEQEQGNIFHWLCRDSLLFNRLITANQVFFDITTSGRPFNVEPYFD